MKTPCIEFNVLLGILLSFTGAEALFDDCDHVITMPRLMGMESGEMKSPNYPDKIIPGTLCRWTVYTPTGTRISVTCMNRQQPKEDICGGWFKIFQNGDMTSHYAHYCRSKPFSVHSSANKMIITYNSTGSRTNGEPFMCDLSMLENLGLFKNCDRVIALPLLKDNETFKFLSPNYPNKDPPGTSCRWTVFSPAGTRIALSCETNYKQPEDNCGGWFTVYVKGRTRFTHGERNCRNEGFTKNSISNNLMITYNSADHSKPGEPFECIFYLDKLPEPDLCHCGMRQMQTARIIGGDTPQLHEYPMMAGLVWHYDTALFCGATIISQNYALTAAHCVFDKMASQIGLLVGEHDRHTDDETDSTSVINLDSIICHERFNKTGVLDVDIALVQTAVPIPFIHGVAAACLPTNKFQFTNETVEVLGWGRTTLHSTTSLVLRRIQQKILDNEHCKAFYPDVTSSYMCAYSKGESACTGDSGGPILWEDSRTHKLTLAGIHSKGYKCGARHMPGIATPVNNYLDWIKEKTAGTKYCKD